jgi:hypothetical protein
MRQKSRFGLRFSPILLAGLLTAGVFAAEAQTTPSRQSGPSSRETSNAQTVEAARLRPGAGEVLLERMLLVLKPDAARVKALDGFLQAQQTEGSAEFHHWLTAEQFANRFSVSASGAGAVAAWLRGEGFSVAPLPAGRGWIEFSGSLAQVQSALGVTAVQTDEGTYRISGAASFPAAISPWVAGLASLDGTRARVAASEPELVQGGVASLEAKKALTDIGAAGAGALTPELARQWMGLGIGLGLGFKLSGGSASLNGAGTRIAIPARSEIRQEDFAAFRRSFGLPEAELEVQMAGGKSEPGRTVEEPMVLLAASWAGVTAPEARIVLVPAASTGATDGLDLALAAIVDRELAHTVSVGYMNCESAIGVGHREFYSAAYRQAAAEGIALIAATGDSGAAACHAAGEATPVSSGYGVNALASTPWNVAVGAGVAAGLGGGLEPREQASATDASYATGGGASRFFATPRWQSALGVPATDPANSASLSSAAELADWSDLAGEAGGYGRVARHHRYLPDISMPGALEGVDAGGQATERGLAYCYAGSTGASGCRLVSATGSAASSALFAGVAALLVQQYGPQGNLAPRLYALERKSSGGIADVAKGSANLVCAKGSLDCPESGTGLIGFDATAGFDLATGLGTVNVPALVSDWAKAQATGTEKVDVEMTNINGTTYNPSATITLSAKVVSLSGGTVPTGTVQFYDATNSENTGTPATLNSSGIGSYTETGEFAVGNHNIEAIYSGDSTYASATSQPVTINIETSPTTLTITPSTTTPSGGSTITVTGVVTSSIPGATPPTGGVTINLDGLAQGTGTLSTTGTTTSATVSVTVPTAGSHNLQGLYSGDINYNSSTSATVAITVAKAATVTSISAAPSTLTPGFPETFTATLAPAGTSTGGYNITGSVSFYDGGLAGVGTLLGTVAVVANTAVLPSISLSDSTVHTIIAAYSGDATYSASDSSPLVLEPVLLPVTVTLTTTNSVLAPGQTANLTATVTPLNTPPSTVEQHPTGTVLFYAGSTLIGQGVLSASVADSSNVTVAVPTLPGGIYVLTAVYSGDSTFGSATSNALNLQVEDFTISCSATSITMVQGTTADVPCTVTATGGLTGPIEVVCTEQNPPPVGAIQCSFTPSIVQGTGATTLTVITTAGNISQNKGVDSPGLRPGGRGGLPGSPPDGDHGIGGRLGGGVALALAGLLLWPIGRRRVLRLRAARLRAVRRIAAMVLMLAALAAAGMGCSNTVTTRTNNGTPLGEATLKITAAAYVNTVTVSHNAYLTVNVIP